MPLTSLDLSILPSSPESATPPARRWVDADYAVDRKLIVNQFGRRPVFGDDVWDLTCLSHRPNASPCRLVFEALPPRWRRTAKELMAQRLNEPVQSIRKIKRPRPVHPDTARRFLAQMVVACDFLDRKGIRALPDVVPPDLLAYSAEVMAMNVTSRWKAGLLKIFDLFYESRDYLSDGGLAFHPFPGSSLLAIAGVEAQEENLTERIPEDVMAHLLFWALAYVDTFAPDILAAEASKRRDPEPAALEEAERRAVAAAAALKPGESRTKGQAVILRMLRYEARLDVYLEGRGEALGIPAWMVKGVIVPASNLIARQAGVPLGYVTMHGAGRDRLRASKLPLRLDCLGEARARLPGAKGPWREPFTFLGLDQDCRRLQVAAYIVIAYLSGMRDSEVQTLKRGCVSVLRDEQGKIYRHKLSGLTYKGEHGRPRDRKWVVIEPVARAVGALEALTDHLHRSKSEVYLFARLVHGDDTMGLFGPKINAALCEFAAHCDEAIAPRLSGTDLPTVAARDGGRWRFKPTQFRRTLAWHIANQPFGVVAGMIQYGHACIQMFEGYAGSSESGFAAEVASDRFLARLSDVVEMFEDDERGIRPAGPMAGELATYFERKRAELGSFPGEVADAKRLRELLKQKAGDLYVGRLVHCFYTPSQARCQKDVEMAERSEPLVGMCDPDCSNACWAQKNLESWKLLHWECESMLKVNSLPYRQREILRRQRGTAKRVVDAIQAAREGGEARRG